MKMDATSAIPPPVVWAQRNDRLYVTITLDDVQPGHTLTLETDKLYFKGKGGHDKKDYEVTLEFFKEVDPEPSKVGVLPRNITMMIMKKEDGPYWDRLLKEKKKLHWLKTDFGKWVDEDDSDDEAGGGMGGGGGGPPGMGGDQNLEQMMAQMGNFNAGGAGGVPGGDPGMADDEDSDDEDLPDLE